MNMTAKPAAADRAPTHPGELLREEVLPALGITVTAAAGFLGVSRQALHKLLAEQVAMTAEMAVRVGKLCGNGPEIWLAMQSRRDLWATKRRLAEDVAQIPTLEAA
jgi:addiction module HigA family antidote